MAGNEYKILPSEWSDTMSRIKTGPLGTFAQGIQDGLTFIADNSLPTEAISGPVAENIIGSASEYVNKGANAVVNYLRQSEAAGNGITGAGSYYASQEAENLASLGASRGLKIEAIENVLRHPLTKKGLELGLRLGVDGVRMLGEPVYGLQKGWELGKYACTTGAPVTIPVIIAGLTAMLKENEVKNGTYDALSGSRGDYTDDDINALIEAMNQIQNSTADQNGGN